MPLKLSLRLFAAGIFFTATAALGSSSVISGRVVDCARPNNPPVRGISVFMVPSNADPSIKKLLATLERVNDLNDPQQWEMFNTTYAELERRLKRPARGVQKTTSRKAGRFRFEPGRKPSLVIAINLNAEDNLSEYGYIELQRSDLHTSNLLIGISGSCQK